MWGTTIGKGTWFGVILKYSGMFAVYSCDLTVCGVCFVPMPARQSFLILCIFIFRRCHSRYLLEQAGEVL